jgi:hypothetical protein
MMRLVVLSKVFTRAMKASFHRGNAGIKGFGNLGVAPAFLHECEQCTVLRPQLRQRMTQRIKLLRIHRTGRLRNIFVLLAERQKYPPQLLPPQLINARVPREPEQPRLELRGSLQAIDGSNHLDEDLLGEIFDIITSSGHGVDKAGDPMLVTDNELPLGGFVALLSPPHKVGQRSR